MRKVWRTVAWTGSARIYSLLVGVAVVAITARQLGPAGRGELAVITTWVSAFATLLHLSLGQVALHRASQAGDDEWLRQAMPVLLLCCAGATLVGWIAAGALFYVSNGSAFSGLNAGLLALGFLLLPLMIWEQYGSALLTASGRLDVSNIAQVQGRSVTLLGVLWSLAASALSVASVVVCNIAGQFVTMLFGLIRLRQHPPIKWRLEGLVGYARAGSLLHFNAIGTFLFASADVLILNHYAGPEETGYYQLGVQLIAVMMVIPQAVSTVLYGEVARLGADAAWTVQRGMLLRTMAVMTCVVALGALLAEWIVLAVAGEGFVATVDLFRLQLVSLLGMTLAAVMAPQWIGRGMFKTASGLTLAIGLANLAMSLSWVPIYGKWGAAFASVATYCIAIVGNGLFALWCERRARCGALRA